jgi:hypothetical protein
LLGLTACKAGITAKTAPATGVTHNAARLNSEGRCSDVRVSGEWWYEYRRVGAPAWTAAGPRHPFACTGPTPNAAAASRQVAGLVPDAGYEFRVAADTDPPGGEKHWVDSTGTVEGDQVHALHHPDASARDSGSAFALRDSIGVVTHIVYYDTAYGDWDKIVWRLWELGVGHVRDGVYANPGWRDWNERYYRAVEQAASLGIKFDFGF